MNRRALLKAFVAVPAAALVAAGATPIRFPARYYSVSTSMNLDELNEITKKTIMPHVVEHFFKDSPFFEVVARG